MNHFVATLVALPDPIKVFIAAAVLFAVRLVLSGRVPDELLTEIAGAITTAVLTLIELGLGLIPPQFEAVANAVLSLIAVLLGTVMIVNGYRLLKARVQAHGLRF